MWPTALKEAPFDSLSFFQLGMQSSFEDAKIFNNIMCDLMKIPSPIKLRQPRREFMHRYVQSSLEIGASYEIILENKEFNSKFPTRLLNRFIDRFLWVHVLT